MATLEPTTTSLTTHCEDKSEQHEPRAGGDAIFPNLQDAELGQGYNFLKLTFYFLDENAMRKQLEC